jgi:hypothetical protein
MPKYVYTGEQEMYFPTLGVTVNNGDEFDAPAGLSVYGVVLKKDLGSVEPVKPASDVDVSVDKITLDNIADSNDVVVVEPDVQLADNTASDAVDVTK